MKEKISKTKLKRGTNQKLFEDFMSLNSKYFSKPKQVKVKEFDYLTKSPLIKVTKILSKGNSLYLTYDDCRVGKKIQSFQIKIGLKHLRYQNIRGFFKNKREVTEEWWKEFFISDNLEFDESESSFGGNISGLDPRDNELFEILKKLKSLRKKFEQDVKKELLNEHIKNEKDKKEKDRKEKIIVRNKVSKELVDLDKDGNGEVDIIEEDIFGKLLSKHQGKIISIDKSYIQHFVKISLLLNDKKKNIQDCFKSLKKVNNEKDLKRYIKVLKNLIHSYELLLFHSISMITSISNETPDLVTFYEIYETFDRLGVFTSNHEREVSNGLRELNQKTSILLEKVDDLMLQINRFESNMVTGLNNLTYHTQIGFSSLRSSITSQLKSINSSLTINNVLTGIQTYKLLKL